MNDGWLWLSILKMTARPSPMSTTPAFSPGPQMTRSPVMGSVFSQIFDDLYEQCSFHIAEKMPSSVSVGSRPIRPRMRWYSSGLRPWAATTDGVMRAGAFMAVITAGAWKPSSSPLLGRCPESVDNGRMAGTDVYSYRGDPAVPLVQDAR